MIRSKERTEPDPRQGDVDETERMVAEANRAGIIPLPGLSTVELCALGGYRHALFDRNALGLWAALPDSTRTALVARALKSLLARELLTDGAAAEDEAVTYRVSPALGIILAARARPTCVATCSAGSRPAPSMFIFGDIDTPTQAAVLEMPRPVQGPVAPSTELFEGGFDYLLAAPPAAADLLVNWSMFLPTLLADGAAELPARVIDIYHHDGKDSVAHHQFTVTGNGKQSTVEYHDFVASPVSVEPDPRLLGKRVHEIVRSVG